jgi:uncharacterized damage-inducible protein DinB
MIDLSRGLRHLAWADDRFFAALAAMPPQALAAQVTPGEWTAGRLAMHIVDGAQWYRYCLTGQGWTQLEVPQDPGDVDALRRILVDIDAVLLEQGAEQDGSVVFEDEDGPRSALRSTILTQACLHAAEHRAQIACALAVAGLPSVSLDDLDLWAFESYEAGQ